MQKRIMEIIVTSNNFNSPVWPFLKPNGTYRLLVDYRNQNKVSSRLPGALQDIEEVIY